MSANLITTDFSQERTVCVIVRLFMKNVLFSLKSVIILPNAIIGYPVVIFRTSEGIEGIRSSSEIGELTK